jgi:hypothetical protein
MHCQEAAAERSAHGLEQGANRHRDQTGRDKRRLLLWVKTRFSRDQDCIETQAQALRVEMRAALTQPAEERHRFQK